MSIDAPYGYISQEVSTFHTGTLNNSAFMLAPLITLDTKWELKDKVTAFVEFQNQRLNPGRLGLTGLNSNADFGGGCNTVLAVKQAYIKVDDFVAPKLAFTYGIQPLKLTLRKGEGAFFMDVSESVVPSNLVIGGQMATTDALMAARGPTRNRGISEFSGFGFNYGSLKTDNYEVGFFWGVTNETGAARTNDKLLGLDLTYKLAGEDNVVKGLWPR
jgi:hypothetical protein